MPGEQPFDVRRAIEQSASKTTIQELAKKGIHRVKVLDEAAIQRLIDEAVKRTLLTRTDSLTDEERERIYQQSRKELDRLMREHQDLKSRTELSESDKNSLVREVENLQEQLKLNRKMTEETARQRYDEGRASMKQQMEDQIQALKERMGQMESEVRGRVRNEIEGEYTGKVDEALRRERDAQERLTKSLEDGRLHDENLFKKMESLFTKSIESLNKKLTDLRLRAIAGGGMGVGAGGGGGMEDFRLSAASIESMFKTELDSNLKSLEAEEQKTAGKIGSALERLKQLREGKKPEQK